MKPFLPNRLCKAMLTLICIVFIHICTYSQHLILGNGKVKVEAGLNFGPSFFLGDLGGNYGRGTHFLKDLNLEETKIVKGAFITIYPTPWLGFRVAGNLTPISAEDKIINTTGEHETYRKQRNLDFKTNIWELYTALELYPTMIFNKYDDYEPRLKPYGFIGVGLFHFNPKGSLTSPNGNKTWYDLQPLRLEGQGMSEYPGKKPYSLTQINIPMGLGLKYDLSDRVTIGTELLYRKTFTDYIDDVSTTYVDPLVFENYLSLKDAAIARKLYDKTNSLVVPANRTVPGEQRGNPKQMDAYFSTVIKIGIKLGQSMSDENRNASRQTRCPHFY
ncbi:MAG: hypothetical protein EOO89_30080 [Pedobacter sp.]|nr:MAG: hypothetical protein EOO89_30080 [Pedobacter sp.]